MILIKLMLGVLFWALGVFVFFPKMITLLQWRVTIGCWIRCKVGGSNLCDTKSNGLIHTLKCGGLLLVVTLGLVNCLSHVLALLLILSGDIELNPGPGRWIQCTVQMHTVIAF